MVGGYLGYVGYFCLAAGISLACGVDVRPQRPCPELTQRFTVSLRLRTCVSSQ